MSNRKEFVLSKKAWIIFVAACVVLLGVLVYLSGSNRIDVSSVDVNKIQPKSELNPIGDHVFGAKDSKVVLIEYGDFQCPGCGTAFPTVATVTEKYKDQVSFVFRNFPLTSLHPNAKAAAAAAEAAGIQGKYWEMNEKIYTNQRDWENLTSAERTDFFANYASDLGLNRDTFKTDLASSKVNQKIAYDQALGKKAKVTATPTFYLNGEHLSQDVYGTAATLEDAIVAKLKAAGIDLPATK